jgi:long-chain-alcohol oxidase
LHPHLFLPFSPWTGARERFKSMEGLPSTSVVGVLLRDREAGEVRVGRDGEPIVRYKLSEYDTRHMRTGIDGAAQILEAAGARRIFSSHAKWVGYPPGASGSRGQFMFDADAAGYGAGQLTLGSFHIMGSARMGGSPATSVCDPGGQTWEVRDLYVLDSSAFPTASGVNPQISIQAIAHMCARGLAARLG